MPIVRGMFQSHEIRARPVKPAPEEGDEGPAFERVEGDITRGLMVVCDHASNALPAAYGTLGLPPSQFERHIAYDIGAAQVARNVARALGVPAVLSRWSRLLIDINRDRDDPTLVMKLSDGAVVPGNREVDAAEIERRCRLYYDSYHREVDRVIDTGIEKGKPPGILSIHSFTPVWKGVVRPWHATILWDRDPRLPGALLAALKAENGLVIGDNVPYSGELKGDSMNRHGTRRGIAHGLIEIRQDLIGHEAGVASWSEKLVRIMTEIMNRGGFNEIRHYGSKSDRRRQASGQSHEI